MGSAAGTGADRSPVSQAVPDHWSAFDPLNPQTECLQGKLLQQLQTFAATASAPGFVAFARATRAGEALRSACDSLLYDALMLKVQARL